MEAAKPQGAERNDSVGDLWTKEYEDEEYWNQVYSSEEEYLEEKFVTEGSDGEEEFDKKVLNTAVGKAVLDVGCGDARFTLRVAEAASEVVGVDFSQTAILKASENIARTKANNIRVRLANANELPFANETFDLVVSRRGPVTDNLTGVSEAYRVLRKSGFLMEVTIGERDKESLTRIFGRGQMYSVKERVSVTKEKMLRAAGFDVIEIKDYLAYEVFETLRDLVIRMRSAPIIPDFDSDQDKTCLDEVERTLTTPDGIRTEVHRVTIIAGK